MNDVDVVLEALEKQLVAALATVRMLRAANKPPEAQAGQPVSTMGEPDGIAPNYAESAE